MFQVKSARRDAQLAQMAEKGVTVELDRADFQAPDLNAPDPEHKPGTYTLHPSPHRVSLFQSLSLGLWLSWSSVYLTS